MKRIFPLGMRGYSWSKLKAEPILLYAQQVGLPLAIFRLPHTGMSSSGFVKEDDSTVRIFAAMTHVEAMPQGSLYAWDNETVDTISQVCTAISLNPRRRYTIYHCCNLKLVSHELELADFGIYWRGVPYESFKQLCQARGMDSPLDGYWILLDYFGPYWFGLKRARISRPICDRSLREDCPYPIKWPSLLTMLRYSENWINQHQESWQHPVYPQAVSNTTVWLLGLAITPGVWV